jgi:hypothetical protein
MFLKFVVNENFNQLSNTAIRPYEPEIGEWSSQDKSASADQPAAKWLQFGYGPGPAAR